MDSMTKKCAEKPCKNCPWKKSSLVGGANIPRFDIDLMRGLSSTVPPRDSNQDGMYKIFACHDSKVGNEFACAGYVAVQGYQNINVRLMAMMGHVDIIAVEDACSDYEMYSNFHEMLDDYEAAQ